QRLLARPRLSRGQRDGSTMFRPATGQSYVDHVLRWERRMDASRSPDGSFIIKLSDIELGTIGNCLNEVCNGIEVFEFQTRIGMDLDYVRDLFAQITEAYRSRR